MAVVNGIKMCKLSLTTGCFDADVLRDINGYIGRI